MALVEKNPGDQHTAAEYNELIQRLIAAEASALNQKDNTGHAFYADTQYTELSPLSILADTDTLLPNNAAITIDENLPQDIQALPVPQFYDGAKVLGLEDDSMGGLLHFRAKPTSPAATYVEVWFDFTGGTGMPADIADAARRIIAFPKGSGEERPINYVVIGSVGSAWADNGGVIKCRSNGPVDIYDVQYTINRLHKSQVINL